MLIGSHNTGKTTLARAVLQAGLDTGKTCAYVDADIGESTVGPPTCTGLKWIKSKADFNDLATADELRFVGATDSSRLVLQMVIATSALVEVARRSADLVVIDTTGTISGVIGETLKYHKVELTHPDTVIAIQRGSEMEPIIGMLRRFFSAEVVATPVHAAIVPSSPDERKAARVDHFQNALLPPLESWRVRPTVFSPTLPTGLNLSRLQNVLVGVQDSKGRCLGLGLLTLEDGALKVLTNVGAGMTGLRLGSVRLDPVSFTSSPVNLREIMFGLES